MLLRTLVAAAVLLASLSAHADPLLFNLDSTNGSTARNASSGPAQGVIVSTTTNLTSFAFYIQTPTAENLKFFITDGTGTSLLYSGVESIGSTSSFNWVSSNVLSLMLNAGSEYYFGVVGDGPSTLISFLTPTVPYSANGLSADTTGNLNSGFFATPAPLNGRAFTDIDLQLYGTQGTAVTPEPSSLLLLSTGVAGIACLLRRRFV